RRSSDLFGRCASKCQNAGCICAPLPPGQKIPRSPANDEAADCFRCLRYTRSRSQQLPKLRGREQLAANVIRANSTPAGPELTTSRKGCRERSEEHTSELQSPYDL